MKRLIQRVLLVCASLFLCAILTEVVLRFLPVQTSRPILAVNADNPVLRYQPNSDFVYSRDGDMAMANRGHVNNWGFVNAQDYTTEGGPLLAVIGDSLIEAIMVPFQQTLTGQLQRELQGKLRVYSFAFSGCSLSDYLAYADYAREHFHPAAMVILIAGNDYDECLPQYRVLSGFYHFKSSPEGLKLTRVDYTPPPVPLAYSSALFRYLYYNLHYYQKAHPEQATVQSQPEQRIQKCHEAVDAFLTQLPQLSGLACERVALLVDGLRFLPDSDQDWKRRFEVPMRTYFMEQATHRGYHVVDLDPAFTQLSREGTQVSFKRDQHWNVSGHTAATQELLKSGVIQGWEAQLSIH